MNILDAAHQSNPNCNWWIKGDGCDVVSGIGESVRLEWSGDVDLNTGELQMLYEFYRSLLTVVSQLVIADDIIDKLQWCSRLLSDEKEFLVKGLVHPFNFT